jgi:hypothetical protein
LKFSSIDFYKYVAPMALGTAQLCAFASLQCNPATSSHFAKIFPERGLSQAAAASLANGGWGYRTVFRTRACCGLGQPALRFGCGSAALRLCVNFIPQTESFRLGRFFSSG